MGEFDDAKLTTLPTLDTSTTFEQEEDVKSVNDEELTTLPTLDASTTSPMVWTIVGCAIGVCFLGFSAVFFVLIWKKRGTERNAPEETPEGEHY